ncbi:hypothetical protein BV25DRAFT_1922243 [Artomyces pyxidatus]|uniref:Uncharacterized protein n=1 Tax=Artomyces pyxidatus TaxID=48021 RepID=A0ACB8SF04_9AGAM|nr:hypothetical protein BV25DRAFT_1922243 [Artomyces pyxidatus]
MRPRQSGAVDLDSRSCLVTRRQSYDARLAHLITHLLVLVDLWRPIPIPPSLLDLRIPATRCHDAPTHFFVPNRVVRPNAALSRSNAPCAASNGLRTTNKDDNGRREGRIGSGAVAEASGEGSRSQGRVLWKSLIGPNTMVSARRTPNLRPVFLSVPLVPTFMPPPPSIVAHRPIHLERGTATAVATSMAMESQRRGLQRRRVPNLGRPAAIEGKPLVQPSHNSLLPTTRILLVDAPPPANDNTSVFLAHPPPTGRHTEARPPECVRTNRAHGPRTPRYARRDALRGAARSTHHWALCLIVTWVGLSLMPIFLRNSNAHTPELISP